MLQQQQRRQQQTKTQQLRLPQIAKPQQFKLLHDITQQSYRIGPTVHYPTVDLKPIVSKTMESDTEIDDCEDPGKEVVERNLRDHRQRMTDYAREELEKVLKRVDKAIFNYEYSVQSSLIQQGMLRSDLSNPEKMADVKEIEGLLGDNLAKQRYKQRLMIFIFDKAEQAVEKSKLLNSLGRFFSEQKESFSGREFSEYDDTGDAQDEIEITLKAFDAKECYSNVKTLGSRLNELNEEIIQFLVQNTGTKQTKVMVERGKRKLAQLTRETKEQISDIQLKLDRANNDILERDLKIQTLEKDLETARSSATTNEENLKKIQEDLKSREAEVKFFKRRNNDYEEIFNRYKSQLGDISGFFSASQSDTEDGEETARFTLDTIDEHESKLDKESGSTNTARDPATLNNQNQGQTEAAPPVAQTKLTAAAAQAQAAADSNKRKSKGRRKSDLRSKKENKDQTAADDPGEIYRRSQQLLESLLASQSEDTPDMNGLFKATRGVDLNNVSMDNLPTAFTNLRKFAIARVKDLLKELETKEATNKETVQILKQEFIEHKTTYEKQRLLYFLRAESDESVVHDEQNVLLEKADAAHKLQMKAQKTAEEALNHLEIFMVEQEKLDQQDEERQSELIQQHSFVLNSMTNGNVVPSERNETNQDEKVGERSPTGSKRSTPSKSKWQKASSLTNSPSKKDPTIFDAALDLKRKSTAGSKSSASKQQSENQENVAATRSNNVSIHDEIVPFSKSERTPSIHSRPLTRSNSVNPNPKDLEKSSSGERSHFNSASQSRRLSIGLNRSPVRPEDLEKLLTQVVNDEIEAFEDFRRTSVKSRTSLRERYISLLEEKKQQLDDLKQKAENNFSRPTTSNLERRIMESMENNLGFQMPNYSSTPLDSSSAADQFLREFQRQKIETRDQEQQTAPISPQFSSPRQEKTPITPISSVPADPFKVPFFHLYETIFQFRHSVTSLLEQNQFVSLADRLEMTKQLATVDEQLTNDYLENSENVLKDTVKVLRTCFTSLLSSVRQNEKSPDEEKTVSTPVEPIENQEKTLIEQEKQQIIDEFNRKYEEINQSVEAKNKKQIEELAQNDRLISEQQRFIQNLQRELMRLQRRLNKVEMQGVVQPSILFTSLDAERNEKILKQAVDKGKVQENAADEINKEMNEYVRLPGRQFNNLVKRYIQHRKAKQLEDRIQSETFDKETKSVLERMGSFYEQRSGQISERISSIRQHRATLARSLTEKFDYLEQESSIFLVRPIFSYQGRAAAQSYIKNETRRASNLTKSTNKTKPTNESRQTRSTQETSTNNNSRQMLASASSASNSEDDDRFFQIEKSFVLPRPTPASQQSNPNIENLGNHGEPRILTDISRLEEFDIQRTLLPISHASLPLSSTNQIHEPDSTVSSLHLRSYIPLTRPGAVPAGQMQVSKSTSEINPVSREEMSALSTTSRITNPRTPFNSTVGDLRKSTPPLPPIKRLLTSSTTPPIDEASKGNDEFIPSVSTNDFTNPQLQEKDEQIEEN